MNCKYLDNQLCVRTDGQFRFCCVSTEPNNKENIRTHTPEDWLNSKRHKDAKAAFARGEWPVGCETCKRKEELGLESKRSNPEIFGPGISHLDIRFGNSCNLQCISCHSYSSSSIASEAKEMHEQNILPLHDVLDITNFNWASEETINQITKFPIREIYLTGGEPMMVKHLPQLLERLDSDVMIRFNTNGTLWNPTLERILKRFKKVSMSMSLDAASEKIHYIRYPSDWKTIKYNVYKYAEFCNVDISPTISILNACYYDEIKEFAKELNVEIYKNLLSNPFWLDVKNAPAELKEKFQDVDKWKAGQSNPAAIEEFKNHITKLDQWRKIKIKNYLPEVAEAYGLN